MAINKLPNPSADYKVVANDTTMRNKINEVVEEVNEFNRLGHFTPIMRQSFDTAANEERTLTFSVPGGINMPTISIVMTSISGPSVGYDRPEITYSFVQGNNIVVRFRAGINPQNVTVSAVAYGY